MFWRCEVFQDLMVRCWEDEVFLFNPHTGHTHILNDLAWRLLSACAEGLQSEAVLIELMANELGEENREELSDLLDGHLDQLMQLGLVEARTDHETR